MTSTASTGTGSTSAASTSTASGPTITEAHGAETRSTTGGTRRWWVLAAVSLVQFMVVIDATVVNVMMPRLHADLGLSPTGLQWVLSSYVLLFGGLMLLGGRLADVLGRRRVLLAGLFLFTAGSLLAGMSVNGVELLCARALQGIAAAAMSPAALSIVVVTFPDSGERTKAFGVWGAVIGIAGSVGTLLGGAMVELGWRWAFDINVPVGVVLLVAVIALVRADRPTGPRLKSDTLGALTSTIGLLSLVYGIVSTTTRGWTDPLTLAALIVGAVLLVGFVLVERRSAAPLVPLRLFRLRGVVAGSLGQLLTAGIMLPTFFLLPLYMQTVLGYSPLQTGLAYIPTSVAMVIVAPLLSKVIGRVGPLALYVLGSLVLGGVIALMLGSSLHGGYWSLLLPVTVLLGVGLVLCMVTTPAVGTWQATEQDAGTTSSLLNASTEIGGALGLAVVATTVQARTAQLTVAGAAPLEALNHGLQRGFAVLFVWVALSVITGIVGFRGVRASS